MALEVKFNLCETTTCTKVKFTDHTGAYNVITNPGGYDENNEVPSHPGTSEFEEATLTITTPSNASFSFDIHPTFPTINEETTFTVNGTDVGYTNNSIVDGIYNVVYTISTDSQTYTASKYFLFSCQLQCCIDKLYAKVTPEEMHCNCDNTYLKAAMEAEGFLCAAKNALACGKISMAKNLLSKAQSICSNLKCKCS